MNFFKLLLVALLAAAAVQISGKVDLVAQAAARLPSSLSLSSGPNFEDLLASRRDAESWDWVGRQEFTLEGKGLVGMFAGGSGEWESRLVQVLPPAGEDETELWFGLADETVVRSMAGPQHFYGALTGRCWSVDSSGNVKRYGSASGSDEGESFNDIERGIKNGEPLAWLGSQPVGETQYLDGTRADGFCAVLLGWSHEDVRSTSLEMTLQASTSQSTSGDYSGDCQLFVEDIGWFSVQFKGTMRSDSNSSTRYKQTYSYGGLCASAQELGCPFEMEVSGSLICRKAAPQQVDNIAKLEGHWERTGDVYAGMVVKFQKVGGQYYGFLTHVPSSVRGSGDWRTGQVKMFASQSRSSGGIQMRSLTGKSAETNSTFDSGTASLRDDGVLVYAANSARGLTGDRQRWQPKARPD